MHGLKCRTCGKVWIECRLHTCQRDEDHAAGICEECLPAKKDEPAIATAPLENVNGFLSGKAGHPWPGAIVGYIDNGEREQWFLRRPGVPDVGLGNNFKVARMALYALIKTTPKVS